MSLRTKLGKGFVFTTELGGINGVLLEESIDKAREYVGLDAINVHDCPNACLRMNSVMASALIQRELGIETIPHFTCRDRSLLGTQADLFGAHALGIRYILPVTGDSPERCAYPSKGVFNYNTFELIKLIDDLNNGKDAAGTQIKGSTEFLVGATATPSAANLDVEIKRMQKKIVSGAKFFQTQATYDVDKVKEFLAEGKKLGKPIILGVMLLKGLKMAQFVDKKIAGVTVPKSIFAELEQGKTDFEIASEFISQIYDEIDGLHIYAMGDVAATNKIIQFTKGLVSSLT
ncbi:MAG TPA: methylenetetrahydrofolate reductase [Desulfosporosinus sp.]|nr:methylenetetrahydrofolate reductase [Desulfosporosinus sp.]